MSGLWLCGAAAAFACIGYGCALAWSARHDQARLAARFGRAGRLSREGRQATAAGVGAELARADVGQRQTGRWPTLSLRG